MSDREYEGGYRYPYGTRRMVEEKVKLEKELEAIKTLMAGTEVNVDKDILYNMSLMKGDKDER